MSFLIDGFNLIYKFPEFEALMYENDLVGARKGLLSILKKYEKITRKHIRVVFDGKKQKSLEIKSEKFGTIDVYYSLEYSADHLIKQFIKKDINPRSKTVITSDKEIIAYVTRHRAKVKTSEEFAEEVKTTIREWEEAKIPEKEEDPSVSGEEIAYWERIFTRKKKK